MLAGTFESNFGRGTSMSLTRAERETLIDRYAAGPALLKASLAKVPPAAMQWRPAPREWSAHEVICHCADSETNAHAHPLSGRREGAADHRLRRGAVGHHVR